MLCDVHEDEMDEEPDEDEEGEEAEKEKEGRYQINKCETMYIIFFIPETHV